MASHERQFLTERVSLPKFKELYAIGEEAKTLALALALALFILYLPSDVDVCFIIDNTHVTRTCVQHVPSNVL